MIDASDTSAFTIGVRTGSDDLWGMAKRDFLAGESAARVCKRYDLGKSTFWARASVCFFWMSQFAMSTDRWSRVVLRRNRSVWYVRCSKPRVVWKPVGATVPAGHRMP